MKIAILVFAGIVLACGGAQAQEGPNLQQCAGAYAALGQLQDQFGTTDSLMAERYRSFVTIKFDDRLAALAGKVEKGISELKTAAEDQQSDLYLKLVDAETEGDMEAPPVRTIIDLSDACDRAYGFAPSLGG